MSATDLLSVDFVTIRAVQDSPEPGGRGELLSVSRRDALKYALAAPVLLSLPAVAATLGTPRASAANQMIDFTGG
jgi:hypothetical protein